MEGKSALSFAVQRVPVWTIEKLVGMLKERKECHSFSGSCWELLGQERVERWKMLQ